MLQFLRLRIPSRSRGNVCRGKLQEEYIRILAPAAVPEPRTETMRDEC